MFLVCFLLQNYQYEFSFTSFLHFGAFLIFRFKASHHQLMAVHSHAFLDWTLIYLDGGKQTEQVLLLCLLVNACCGAGRRHADGPHHMVLLDSTVGRQCGRESARLLSRASGSDGVGEAVGGVRAGKSDCSVPPTFITGCPVSASNQITTESSTKTWLKARLFVFY